MIEQIGIQNFQNGELLNFMIDEVKDARTIEASELKKTLDLLDGVLATFQVSLKKKKASVHTEQVLVYDRARDEKLRNLRQSIRGAVYLPDNKKREAAKRLMALIRAYKGLETMSYRNESEHMNKLVQELRERQYASDVQLLGIKQWVDEMETANKEFDKFFDERDNEMGGRVIYDKRDLRRQIKEQYEQLLNLIHGLFYIKPSKPVELFIGRHNERVRKMQSLFAFRKTTNSKALQAKRAMLHDLAIELGWVLPEGQEDFQYFGGTRIMHPVKKQWYILGKKNGKDTLVKYVSRKKKTSSAVSPVTEEAASTTQPVTPPAQGGGGTSGGSGSGAEGSIGGGL